MAVLSKIRKRSLLVIGVVGMALGAFVLMDLLGSGSFGSSVRYAGSINGKDISADEFRMKVANQEQQVSGWSTLMISNGIWNQEVKNALYEEQYEKIGLGVGKAHITSVFEQNPQIGALDENGKFSQEKFNNQVELMKIQNPNGWRFMLENYEKQLENMAKDELYNTLVKAGLYVTNFEGKMLYQRENNKVNISYVMIPFSSINDEEVTVTDQEITDYMNKRKKKYKGEESRDFEYILVETKASDDDIREIEDRVASLLEPKIIYNEIAKENETIPGFAQIENIEEFVNENSDISFNEKYIFEKDLPSMNDTKIGTVTSLYKEDDYIKISRILDQKMVADSVKSSHIIIPYIGSRNAQVTTTKEQAKQKADSIYDLVKNNDAKFKEIANEINTDGTKGNDGSLDWIMYSQITYNDFDKDFAEFIFFKPKGSIEVVETQFGYHIIKINDTGSRQTAYKVATIAQQIEPSSITNEKIYSYSQTIEVEAQSKSMDEIATEHDLKVVPVNGITITEENIEGLGKQRDIIRWTFNKDTKEKSVNRFDISEGFVIVKLKKKNDNGLQSIEKNRATIEPIIRKEKKTAMIIEKTKGTTLEEIAQNTEQKVSSKTGLSLTQPQGVGAKVVARAFTLEPEQISEGIEGPDGVYFIKNDAVVKAYELPNYASFVNTLKTQTKNSATTKILPALTDIADIKDNRINSLGY